VVYPETNRLLSALPLSSAQAMVFDQMHQLLLKKPVNVATGVLTIDAGGYTEWDTAVVGNVATLNLAQPAVTVGKPNNFFGGTLILYIVQGAPGSFTLSWENVFRFAGGTPPTLSTAVGAIDIVTIVTRGDGFYDVAIQNDFQTE